MTKAAQSACTRVLEDAAQPRNRRLDAFLNRPIAYGAKGDLDRALADKSAALKIDPGSAIAYTARGNLYFLKGEVDRAIGDFDAANQA